MNRTKNIVAHNEKISYIERVLWVPWPFQLPQNFEGKGNEHPHHFDRMQAFLRPDILLTQLWAPSNIQDTTLRVEYC